MNPQETEACLRILFLVAAADEDVVDEEDALFEKLGHRGEILTGIDLDTEVAKLVSPEGRQATFDAAVAMASVDGRCSPKEHALLERIQQKLGVSTPLRVIEADWLERLREPRRRLREANDAFLDAIAAAGELPRAAYQGLVSHLQQERHKALEDVKV
jgi:uncharacterized tellurite resistance protein B-like protein